MILKKELFKVKTPKVPFCLFEKMYTAQCDSQREVRLKKGLILILRNDPIIVEESGAFFMMSVRRYQCIRLKRFE